MPAVKDYDDLNAHLLRKCLEERERTSHGQTETIGVRFERERAAALAHLSKLKILELARGEWIDQHASGVTVALEITGYEDDEVRAKHTAAWRWVSAVNNWGQLGRWELRACREPQQLGRELKYLLERASSAFGTD